MFYLSITRSVSLRILSILLLLFCFRVAAQLIQLVTSVSFLPGFDAWHSASIPYSVLLGSQGLIIAVALMVIVKIYKHSYRANNARSTVLLWLGWLYFLFMTARFLLSISIMQSHPWFGATLPAIFHIVLALFLIVLGAYEKSQLNDQETKSEA